jgi:YbbR domain-containing protein
LKHLDRLRGSRESRGWLEQLSSVAISLVLAFLIWLVASEEARPMTEQQYPIGIADGLEIEFTGVPDGLSVYDPNPRIAKVRLRGIEDGFRGLDPSDFVVVADLSDETSGTRSADLPLSARCASSCGRRGVRVLGTTPGSVSLRLSPTMTRTLAVELAPVDDLDPGYLIGSFVVTPTDVSLVGATIPASRVRRIAAELTGLGEVHGAHLFSNVPVVAVDNADQVVDDLVLSPTHVDVHVRPRRSQAVAVVPSVQGETAVADGYFFSGVWVEPQMVELDGPADLVRDIGSAGRVYTVPIDLSGAAGDATYEVALDLPEGVTAMNAPQGVTVTIEIEALPGTRTLELEIQREGLRDGLVAAVTPDRVQVLLSGPEPDLEALEAAGSEGVTAVVNLAGLGPGAHRVSVSVDSPPGLWVGSITPDEVDVTIRSAAGTSFTPSPEPVEGI